MKSKKIKPCTKITYKTKLEADFSLKNIIKKVDGRPKPIRSYLCDNCGKYHLTSKTKKEEIERIAQGKALTVIDNLKLALEKNKEEISKRDILILELNNKINNLSADIEGLEVSIINQQKELARFNNLAREDESKNILRAKLTHRHRVEDLFFENRPRLIKQFIKLCKENPFEYKKKDYYK